MIGEGKRGRIFNEGVKEALGELREVLAGRYKILVPDQSEYDTSMSFDPEEARRVIEQARTQADEGSNDPFRSGK